jgi:hypothetical protein
MLIVLIDRLSGYDGYYLLWAAKSHEEKATRKLLPGSAYAIRLLLIDRFVQ